MNFVSARFLRLKILIASNRCKFTPTKEFHISSCGLNNEKFTERFAIHKPCEKVKTILEHATTGITENCTGPANNSLVTTGFKLSDSENEYVDCLTEAHFKPMKHVRFRKRRKIIREKLSSEWIKPPNCSHILEQLHILVIKNLCREILGHEDYWTIHLNNPIPLPLRIAHKKLSGLTNQEVQDHFRGTDCLVEVKEQSFLKKKKNSSSRTPRKKLTVNNDESDNKEPCTTTNQREMVKDVSICGQSQKNTVETRTTRKTVVPVKNEEDTIKKPAKSVGLEPKYFPVQFDKPGLKSFLLSAYKGQMTHQKIYKHPAFKFSQDDLEKAMEAIEKNPKTQFCSQITKFELATYLLMKHHEFDEDSVAFCENENFQSMDDAKKCATAQSISSENSFEEKNDEACDFDAKFTAKFELNIDDDDGDEIENYESYLNPCSNRGYADDFYHRQPQRLLSTSSEKFLKIPEKFLKSRSFSTSSKVTAERWNAFFVKTPTFVRRLRVFRQLYNYKALIDPSFNEADFLEGCKLVSSDFFSSFVQ